MEVVQEDVARAIGRVLERMAQRTRDEPEYIPHPIAVAMAEAVRGGNLTDGDGTFGAMEQGYQVHMSKRGGHFALLGVARLETGRMLPAEAVLRVLQAHDAITAYEGDTLPRGDAEELISNLLGLDDRSSAMLLRKAGLADETVPKAALLEYVEALPA